MDGEDVFGSKILVRFSEERDERTSITQGGQLCSMIRRSAELISLFIGISLFIENTVLVFNEHTKTWDKFFSQRRQTGRHERI